MDSEQKFHKQTAATVNKANASKYWNNNKKKFITRQKVLDIFTKSNKTLLRFPYKLKEKQMTVTNN